MSETFFVFGGDDRQRYLAELLAADGFSVRRGEEAAAGAAGTVLLPVPSLTREGLLRGTELPFSAFLAGLPAGTTVWGVGLAPFREGAAGLRLLDYGDDPEFAAKNAVPTAEGALQLAMEELPTTIRDGKFLVIGYGRIGSRLAAMLDALGGSVTVARREPRRLPYRVDRTGDYRMPLFAYDAVFNTVPFPVFTAEHCAGTREDCLLIDLASAPGGIAKDSGRRLLCAPGLPAKVAPKTAAQIMKQIILSKPEE